MTEHEWLASSDPQAMLRAIQGKVSDRKLRLFGCACVRHVWHLLDDKRSRHAVEMAERYADGLATQQELAAAWSAARSATMDAAWDAAMDAAWSASRYATRSAASSHQCILLRDIIGNPFRNTQILTAIRCPSTQHQIDYGDDPLYKPICRQCGGTARRSWLTPTVKGLAQAAYEERVGKVCPDCDGEGEIITSHRSDCFKCHGTGRLETGQLDPDRLLILADALEEAGCDCEEVLRHLRKCLDPHVRGCWVIDLLLGKE